MNHESAVTKARESANGVLTPAAAQNDKAGRFSDEAIKSLGEAGLLGIMLPVDVGGAGLGPRTFAVRNDVSLLDELHSERGGNFV